MGKVFRALLLIAGAIILVLALTNPGMKRFKESSTSDMGDEQRVSDYLIFSIYQRGEHSPDNTVKYIGVLLNFYRLK